MTTKNKVRQYFLQNPNGTLQQIANHFELSKSTVQEYLMHKLDLSVVKSYVDANVYFLFNGLTERKINTKNDGVTIINTQDFSCDEKRYMKSFGLFSEI